MPKVLFSVLGQGPNNLWSTLGRERLATLSPVLSPSFGIEEPEGWPQMGQGAIVSPQQAICSSHFSDVTKQVLQRWCNTIFDLVLSPKDVSDWLSFYLHPQNTFTNVTDGKSTVTATLWQSDLRGWMWLCCVFPGGSGFTSCCSQPFSLPKQVGTTIFRLRRAPGWQTVNL